MQITPKPKARTWKGPRNIPTNLKAKERRRKRVAQRVTRKAYNGQ